MRLQQSSNEGCRRSRGCIQRQFTSHATSPQTPRRGLASTSSWRVRGAPRWAWVSPACDAARRGAARLGRTTLNHPSSPSPSHTHTSPALPSLGLCLDVRGYCSRRFHVQSFGHVFQVLIKLYEQKPESHKKRKSILCYSGRMIALVRIFSQNNLLSLQAKTRRPHNRSPRVLCAVPHTIKYI